jgi:hypothetical protein
MVKFYVVQIRLGNITLSEVPERWRAAVEDSLKEKAW